MTVLALRVNEYGVAECRRHGVWALRPDRRCEHCERERLDDLEFWDGLDYPLIDAEARVRVALGLLP